MEKKNICLGVIGGMGPLASQMFYGMVIDNTEAACDQDHIDMLILSHASMPDRTRAIKEGRIEELFARLLDDARFLERSGAGYIAIPCNTSHVLIDRLQKEIGIPIINMVKESAAEVRRHHGSGAMAGIMATDGTIATGLYQKALEEEDIVPVIPSQENQKKVMRIIYDGIKAGRSVDPEDLRAVRSEFDEKGCTCGLLACTELSCYKIMEKLPEYYMDSMEVLAKKAVTFCGKELRQ